MAGGLKPSLRLSFAVALTGAAAIAHGQAQATLADPTRPPAALDATPAATSAPSTRLMNARGTSHTAVTVMRAAVRSQSSENSSLRSFFRTSSTINAATASAMMNVTTFW